MIRCQQCKNFKTNEELEVKGACSDSIEGLSGNLCCYKNVCAEGCWAKCSLNHWNLVDDDQGTKPRCSKCKERLAFNYVWWGESLEEYNKRH